jgi:hypothetical protein
MREKLDSEIVDVANMKLEKKCDMDINFSHWTVELEIHS